MTNKDFQEGHEKNTLNVEKTFLLVTLHLAQVTTQVVVSPEEFSNVKVGKRILMHIHILLHRQLFGKKYVMLSVNLNGKRMKITQLLLKDYQG